MSSKPKLSINGPLDIGRVSKLIVRPNWPRDRVTPLVDSSERTGVLANEGREIIRGLIDPALCDLVVQDYLAYEQRMLRGGVALIDGEQRNYRLTNFHLVSSAALDIGCTNAIHEILDTYFGRRSMVYTSLYYKHGSQQATHIDTPFFVSNPIGWFAGVWVALEDVRPEAGPVEYYPRAHRLFDSLDKLTAIGYEGDLTKYFQRVEAKAATVSAPEAALLKKGDVLIWHHGLPHAGRKATNRALTRHSMVFHMGAEGVNIRTSGLFDNFGFEFPRYGTFRHRDRSVARVGLPAVMQ